MISVKPADLPRYTATDYALWDGDWELIGGIPYAMTPSPILRHRSIIAHLSAAILTTLADCPECMVVSECDWHVDEATVVRPDLAVVCHADADGFIVAAPEVLFEVLSPPTASRDHGLKRELYEVAGVRHYVIVDAARPELLVRVRDGDGFAEPVSRDAGTLSFDGVTCPFSIDLDAALAPFRR